MFFAVITLELIPHWLAYAILVAGVAWFYRWCYHAEKRENAKRRLY
jgi:hypothetical protein